jgi:acyl-coenzyme A thioesterase PaaI-like protein
VTDPHAAVRRRDLQGGTEVVDLTQHPQLDRFVAAVRGEGFAAGEVLPYHQPGCYGCGPDNDAGLGLEVRAADGDAVAATYTFVERFGGGPGVAHGGAIAAAVDDLFGALVVRLLVPAVTAELSLDYRRAVHLGAPCELRAELVDRDERDLWFRATLEQDGSERVAARARFRCIELERLATRYER